MLVLLFDQISYQVMLSFPIVELFLFALYQPDRGLVPVRWTADKGPPVICNAVKNFGSKLF